MRGQTVERKIYFYRVDIGRHEDGTPVRFDPARTLEIIADLPFTVGDGRYEEEPDGNVLCGIPTNGYRHLRFCRIRRTGLPQLEKFGRIEDLNIDSDTGLLEPTHIVFFENNVVGIEYNHYGPRASRLGPYLDARVSIYSTPIALFPLLRRDVTEQLLSLKEIRLFEFRIRPSYTDIIRRIDDSLADAFDATNQLVNQQSSIQLTLRASKTGRKLALRKLLNPIAQLLQRSDLYDNVYQFKVRGYRNDTHRVETIDLMSNFVVASKPILRLNKRSRALKSDSVFEAIYEAYTHLKRDIELAATIEHA